MTVKITLNRQAVRALLKDPKVAADLARRADAIARQADVNANDPGGHRVDSQIGRNRARSAVITATPKSMWKEAAHRTLTSAIDAGRR